MGKFQFGNLSKIRHQIQYTLSPYEQRPFAKAIKTGLPNSIRRIVEEAPFVLPPLLAAYAVYSWTSNEAIRLHRKAAGHH